MNSCCTNKTTLEISSFSIDRFLFPASDSSPPLDDDALKLTIEERHTMQAFERDKQLLADKQMVFERDMLARREALADQKRKEARNAAIKT